MNKQILHGLPQIRCREDVLFVSASIGCLLEHSSKDLIITKYHDVLKKLTHERRRNEFIAGRIALHHLCDTLGHQVLEIKADHQGMPIFPETLKGSLSHSQGNLIGMVTNSPEIYSLGVDLESIVSLERAERLLQKIAGDDEFNILGKHFAIDKAFTIIFAAKEALFKAVYPLVKSMFWFEDAILVGYRADQNLLRFQMDARIAKQSPSVKFVLVEWTQLDQAILCTCFVTES